MEQRGFVPDDVSAMQKMASRLWPLGRHPGGLGWEWGRAGTKGQIALFLDHGDLIGWAAVSQPETLWSQAEPGDADVARAIVDFWLATATGSELWTEMADADAALVEAAKAAGFVAKSPMPGMWRDVSDLPAGRDDGYVIRPVNATELVARVEVHRATWLPAALPWNEGDDPEVHAGRTSSFDVEMYERVRRIWLYDPALDMVAVAPDGSLAGCCIGWLDPSTGVAEIEPLGVHPSHRRRGLAGAMCLGVVAGVAARGGREAFIGVVPGTIYPGAEAYAKAGFRTRPRGHKYMLKR